jgi:hypothetical protein
MSRNRRILLFVALASVIALGPLTTTSPSVASQYLAADKEQTTDWCCVAGLSCCIIPPNQ